MQTFRLLNRLADRATFGKIAQLGGVTLQTAEAWGREPESNANPFGTGRKNPLDCVMRLIALAHRDDPALAREMAEAFTTYADYLDGKTAKASKRTVNELIGASVKEHTDVVVALLNQCPPDFDKAHSEIVQAQLALGRLDNWVQEEREGQRLKAV